MTATTLPIITYILVTTFTPGPNNIAATTAGHTLGYKKALPFLGGMALGFFAIMFLSGYFNLFLQSRYAVVAGYVKWLGFAYMLWLGVSLFLHGKGGERSPGSFSLASGFLLQLINPKVILYGITLYGMLGSDVLDARMGIALTAIGFSLVGLAAVSTWCLAGSVFSNRLKEPRTLLLFNLAMAALLLYSAISIIVA